MSPCFNTNLLVATTEDLCMVATEALQETLQELGYRVSAEEAQVRMTKVTYLGFKLKLGVGEAADKLIYACEETILGILMPAEPTPSAGVSRIGRFLETLDP